MINNFTILNDDVNYDSDYIRIKQHILLLLNHGSYCKSNNCNLTQCKELKDLWNHIIGCNNRKCNYTDCILSRYLLKHNLLCTNSNCQLCIPIQDRVNFKANNSVMLLNKEQLEVYHDSIKYASLLLLDIKNKK